MQSMIRLFTTLLFFSSCNVFFSFFPVVSAYDAFTQAQILKTIEDGRNFSLGTDPHLQEIFVGRCYAVLGASPSFSFSSSRPSSLSPRSLQGSSFPTSRLPSSSSLQSSSSSPPSKIQINNNNNNYEDPLSVCTELWDLFSSSFRYKNDTETLPSAFLPYFSHPTVLSTLDPAVNKALFWSGVSSFIPTYQGATGVFVMEVSSLIEIVSDLMFCGSPDAHSGYDYKSCVYGDFNTTGDGQWHGAWVSYWAAASLAYAPRVSGNITILLRGSPSPYRRSSFFGSCEVPNLPASKITGVQIFVVPTENGEEYDHCGENSLIELESDLMKVGVNASLISCTDNPPLIRLIDCLHSPVSSQCLLNYN